MFKCIVNQHVNNCYSLETLQRLNWNKKRFNNQLKWFFRCIWNRNENINRKFFKILNNFRIFVVNFFWIDDVLFQNLFIIWSIFELWISIIKNFFENFLFLINMICWSTIFFFANKAFFNSSWYLKNDLKLLFIFKSITSKFIFLYCQFV